MKIRGKRGQGSRAIASALLGAYVSLIAGCGSSAEQFVHTSTGDVGPAPSVISGTLFLGRDIPDAPIEVLDTSGNLLARTRTNDVGDFLIPNYTGPSDFRVVANFGDDLRFSTEVRGYTENGRYVVINVPTTLVSRYMQSHPGIDPTAAEDKIQALLNFPTDRSLEYGVEEAVRMPFSHLAFFHTAAEQGGWNSYASRLVAAADASRQEVAPARGFRLTRPLAHRSLEGIDQRVRPYLEEFLSRQTTRMDLVSHEANPAPSMKTLLEGGVGGIEADEPQPVDTSQVRASIATSIVKYTAEAIGTKTQEQLVDAGWTHIADALNLNYGTTRMLEEIQDQLNEVIGMVSALSDQIQTLDLKTATTDLDTPINNIETLISELKNANPGPDGIGGTPGLVAGNTSSGTVLDNPETPYQRPDEVNQLLGKLAGFSDQVSLTEIQNEMLGTGGATNVLVTNRNDVYSDLGVGLSNSFGNSTVRSKPIIDKILIPYEYYSQIQQNACTVIGELAHVKSPNPTADIKAAAQTIADAADSLKKQRGQLPQYLMSDKIVVDLQAGLMFYYKVQGATDIKSAESAASNFTLDVGNGLVYTDWHLSSDQELYYLQDRARSVATSLRDPDANHDGSDSSAGNYGYSAAGLPALGFDKGSVDALSSDAYLWCQDLYWSDNLFGDNAWYHDDKHFQFNHSNAITDLGDDDSGTMRYIYVRNIGEPCITEEDDDDREGYPHGYSAIDAREFSTLGYISALSFVEIVNGKAGATATYTVATGGNTSIGGDSYSLSSRSYTHYVDTYTGYANNYAGTVNLAELVSYKESDSQGALTVGYDGTIYWHNDTANKSSSIPMTASVVSTSGSTVSGSGTFSSSSTPVRSVVDVQVWPRNKRYDMSTVNEATDNYFALAFYSDNTIADVTSSATWSLAKSGGGTPASVDLGNSSTAGKEITIYNNVLDELLGIAVSFGGQSDSASTEVFNDAPPLVSTVTPGFGPTTGGTLVTLRGNNLVSVSAVHFNGVSVPFTADTETSQVTFTTPTGLPGGAPITVTTPNGTSAVAIYQYVNP